MTTQTLPSVPEVQNAHLDGFKNCIGSLCQFDEVIMLEVKSRDDIPHDIRHQTLRETETRFDMAENGHWVLSIMTCKDRVKTIIKMLGEQFIPDTEIRFLPVHTTFKI